MSQTTENLSLTEEKIINAEEEKINNEQKIIDNILKYINENQENLENHYLTVKTSNGQNNTNKIYDIIDINTYNRELLKVSTVILTANYYECEILNYNVSKNNEKKIKQLCDGLPLFNDSHIVKAYIMEINNYIILHLHAPETGSNTPCGSSDLVRYVANNEYLNPTCIISFGICYGTNCNDFLLGDTLIAEKIYPWSIGIKINNDGWNIKCDDYIINLREKYGILYERIDNIIKSTQNLCPNQKAKMGNMLTSEAVVSNERIKIEAIQKAYGCNIIGGEMEGYGLAKECIYYNQIPCVILKAICDWGAVKNIDKYISKRFPTINNCKDKIQAYTTYCAYRVLKELFDNEIFEKKNILDSIYDALNKKHYPDGSIREIALESFIEEYLQNNFNKHSRMILDSRESMKKVLIEEVKNHFFTSCLTKNGNVCYIFNQLLI